jgi:diadenosine tetraphosphate (Ap4A) HIT family hydrolase
MPRSQWDAWVRGEGCPLCRDLASNVRANEYRYTVADLAASQLWLSVNQSVPGYCVLVCTKHVREPYDLAQNERMAFFEDMMRAAQALESVFHAVKMNFEILGNAVPHLHCHIKPRYYGDPAPGKPIHPDERVVRLSPNEYEHRVGLIRVAL